MTETAPTPPPSNAPPRRRWLGRLLALLLVAALVRGFTISGFWTAFFASIFIAILSLALGALLPGSETSWYRIPHTQGSTIWL